MSESPGASRQPGAALRGHAPRLAVMRVLVALTATLTLLAAVALLWHERRQALDQALVLADRRAALLADELQSTLALAQTAQRRIEQRLQALPAGAGAAPAWAAATADIDALLADLPLPVTLHALGADGRPIADTDARNATGGVRLAPPAGTAWQIEPPRGGPGQRVLPLLRAAAPNPVGVAAFLATVDHAVLLRRFDASRDTIDGSAALFRVDADGTTTLLARAPQREEELGLRLRGPLADALRHQSRGSFQARTQLDGVERLVAYQRLDGDARGLVVACGVVVDSVLAPWWSLLRWGVAVTLLLLAALLVGGRRLDRALRSLQRSENHFRTLTANLPDVVSRLDADGRLLYANDAVRQAIGQAPEAVIGHTLSELGQPDELVARWQDSVRQALDRRQPVRMEFSLQSPQGLRQWESVVTPEPVWRRGEPPTVLVISRDITERNEQAAASATLSRHLVDLLETMSDGFVSLDRQWRYQSVNQRAAEMLGRDAASLIGKHIWTEFPEGLGQPFQRAYERAMNEGVATVLEEHYLPWDRWFENRIHPTATGISIFFTDITDRVRASQALRASEARYRELVENNPAPMLVYDRKDLRLLAVNEAFVQQYGYTRDEALALTLPDLAPPEDRPSVAERVSKSSGPAPVGELRQLRKDGAILIVEARSHDIDFQGRGARIAVISDITERRRAEAERREASARFEKLFIAAPEAISLSELDSGRFLQVNAAFCELFGYRREEVIGHSSAELALWTSDRRQMVIDRLRAGEPVHGLEGVGRQRSGELVDVLYSAERVEFGGTPCLLLMFRDISQRKKAEEALRRSEQRFRLAAATGQVWEWDFGAGGVNSSSGFIEALGHPSAEASQLVPGFEAVIHPDDLPLMKQVLVRHLKRQGPYWLQFRAVDSAGELHWFETQGQAVWDDRGRATYMAGTTFEITQRRHAEDQVRALAAELEQRVIERTEQLARSEARYRSIFETVPVAIAEEDWSGVQRLLRGLREQGVDDIAAHLAARPGFVRQCLRAVRVLRLNQQAQTLYDAQDPAQGTAQLECFYPRDQDLPPFADELVALWKGQRRFSAGRAPPGTDGARLSLMLTMSLPTLDDDDGMALACLVDITEIDRLNAELDRSVARLRQVNQELETFTYSVSHDLKAPLRGIDGYSRLLLHDHAGRLDDEGREFIANIRRATQHMGQLIDDLLAYSRLERRSLTLASQPLAAVVDSVRIGFERDIEAAGVELDVRVDPSLHVLADTQGLRMALRNVIDNAIKFSRTRHPPRIVVSAERRPEGVCLAVQDNGVGFDMKFHDRIFSIFQRLHRAEDYPGTGIGLAIVHKAMERMGGSVSARSQPDRGATFTLQLPAADPP